MSTCGVPFRGAGRPRTLLLFALGIGLVVRLARVARDPLVHPDGPAYLDLATALARGELMPVLGGYFSPLYPAAVSIVAATGLGLELAGRLTAVLAGVALLPLVYSVARRLLGESAAGATVLVAAVQPALVKSSAQVLPETLAGTLLAGWLLVLLTERDGRPATAGMLAGATYLARPEGVMLVPLGLWRFRRRPRGALLYLAAALLVMAPALVALRIEHGQWQLSPREGRIAARSGATSFIGAATRHPVRFLGGTAVGAARQAAYDAKALGPLLWVPFVAGLLVARGADRWPLVVVLWFTALPLAINPSPRYAVPLLSLLLPWAGAGIVALGQRLGRHAGLAAAAVGTGLVVQALWVSHPFDAACTREVSALLLRRYGPGQALVAVDGRFAYGARGKAIVPRSTDPAEALALARRYGARLWLTRPAWIAPPWTAPADVRPVARPCGGAFVLFDLDGS